MVSGLCLALLMAGAAQAGLEESGVRIDTGDSANGLVVTVSGKQADYRVDELIVLSIRGNKTFFLWTFTEDDNGNAIVLVPSRHQSGNKYEAGRSYRLPNPGLNFFADAPGSHLITLVASTRWLDVDLERLGTVEQMDAAFAAKGIGIREDRPRTEGIVIRHLPVRIEGAAAAAPADDTLVFARMDRDEYRIGERFRLVYGATESGWLQVYVHEPDGAPVRLTEQAVDEHRLYEVAGRVTGPAGRHEVRAYFKPGESPGESRQAAGEFAAKGLVLDDDEQAAAVYPFTVRQ